MPDSKPAVAWCTQCNEWVFPMEDGTCPEEGHGEQLLDERPDKQPLGGNNGVSQKRCAKCGERYDAEFDACPKCVKQQQTHDALDGCGKSMSSLGCLLTLFVTVPILLFVVFGFGGCG